MAKPTLWGQGTWWGVLPEPPQHCWVAGAVGTGERLGRAGPTPLVLGDTACQGNSRSFATGSWGRLGCVVKPCAFPGNRSAEIRGNIGVLIPAGAESLRRTELCAGLQRGKREIPPGERSRLSLLLSPCIILVTCVSPPASHCRAAAAVARL